MDIDKLKKRYFPTGAQSQGKKTHDNFSDFVEMRFKVMADAQYEWYARVHRTFRLWDVFQPWLLEGENFEKAIRFPTLRDASKAIKDEIMKAPPEAIVVSDTRPNRAQAIEFKTKEIKDNIYEKRVQEDCIQDMLFTGIGYRQTDYYDVRQYNKDGKLKKIQWDDIGSERLDPTCVFWDDQGRYIWEPKGRDRKRDCIIKYMYPYSTFVDYFQEMEGFDIKGVEPFYVKLSGDTGYATDRQNEESRKQGVPMVYVYKYMNQEIGQQGYIANRKTIKPLHDIPNNHGRINIVAYQFEKRRDTFYPQSLAELIAPHIYAQDTIFNLEMMGLKLDLMPATLVDSDLGYNSKIHKLRPRAVWSMNVPQGKSLRDSVHPFQRAQRDSNGFYNMNNYIESQLTVTSGHDRKSLYLDPNELATQTAAKRQSAERAVNALVFSNELEAEAQLTELMVSDIKQYLGSKQERVGKDGETVKRHRKVRVEGYVVKQQADGEAKFEPSQGQSSMFDLTEESIDVDATVQVKDMRAKMLLQETKVTKLMQFLSTATNVAQIDPAAAQKLDAIGIIEQLAENMDLDMKRTIKNLDGSSFNVIQKEHIAMMLGVPVPVPKNESYEESIEHLKGHKRFRWIDGKERLGETNDWKNAKEFQRKAWQEHVDATFENLKLKVLPQQEEEPQQPEQGPPSKVPMPNQQLEKKDNVSKAGFL